MTARVKAAFTGPVKRPWISLGHRLGLLLALAGLLVLPLIYLALVAATAWLVVWHFQTNHTWMASAAEFAGNYSTRRRGKGVLIAGFLYVGVGMAGAICVAFLIKPLFAPKAKEPPPVTLDPISEPALFALIHQLCDLLGAPRPVQVMVNCEVNASAEMLGFFSGKMRLCFGMPLAAGLTTPQFAAVLAHEFGHFAQGGSMRMCNLVRRINRWFGRVAMERDAWDERLQLLRESDSWFGSIGRMAAGAVWAGRLVLRGLLRVSMFLTGNLSRHMEYDADRRAATIAGSQTMAETLLRLEVLDRCQEAVMEETAKLLKNHGAVGDNVPLRMRGYDQAMPTHVRQKIEKNARNKDAEWWQSHPSLTDRQKSLTAFAAPGVFHLDVPVTHLFRDFNRLSKNVSAYCYEVELGLDLNELDLIDMQLLEGEADRKEECDKAVAEIFGTEPSSYRMVAMPADLPDHATQVALVDGWKSGYHTAFLEEDRLRKIAMHQISGCRLADIGFPLHMLAERHIDCRSRAAAEASMQAGVQAYQTYSSNMQVFEVAAWGRVGAALALHYRDPGTNDEWRQQVTRLVNAQRALAGAAQHYLGGWMDSMAVCAALKDEASYPGGVNMLHAHLRQWDQRLHGELVGMVRALAGVPDPFSSEPRPLSACLPPLEMRPDESYHAWGAFDRMRLALHGPIDRVTGELCLLARELERNWERQECAVMQKMNGTPQTRAAVPAQASGWRPVMAGA